MQVWRMRDSDTCFMPTEDTNTRIGCSPLAVLVGLGQASSFVYMLDVRSSVRSGENIAKFRRHLKSVPLQPYLSIIAPWRFSRCVDNWNVY